MQPARRTVSVAEVMTSKVRSAAPEQGLEEIWRLLREERCHHIPIVERGRPVGMISSRDLVRVAREQGLQKLSAEALGGRTAGEVMTRELQTIHSDEPIDAAIDRIGEGRIHALVVLDDDDRLVGIVTHRDLLDHLIG